MSAVTISTKGQIVIPKKIREALGIKPKQKVLLKLVKNHAEIIPLPENPVKSFCGIFKKGTSLTQALLKARKEENILEKNKITRLLCPARLPKKGR